MNTPLNHCSFCGAEQARERPLISGRDGLICEPCVTLAAQMVEGWARRRRFQEPLESPPTPHGIKEGLDAYVIGQSAAKETLAVAIYNHYKRLHAETMLKTVSLDADDRVEVDKSNILLLGPSGTGKTLLARTLARIVGVPLVIADATTLTQAGYVGDDVESLLTRLLNMADGNVGLAEWGIIYLDEVDKLARTGGGGHGLRDVSGEGVQQALLKLVEGEQVKVPTGRGRKEGGDHVMMDTRNVLFIAGGAFEGLKDLVDARTENVSVSMGFQGAPEPEGDDAVENHALFGADRVHPEDLRRFGIIPELIGRFPVIAQVEALTEDDLVHIMTEPRNALVRQYRQLFAHEGTDLEVTDDALRAIARLAQARGTGARGLRGVFEHILSRTMYDLPSMDPVALCIVDEAAALGTGPVHMVPNEDTDDSPEENTLPLRAAGGETS
ncbi:MAG: ATP-dependent Clp protease ATP-binding subunit ClpX [Magnetospiraceae bacterium]